MKKLVLGIFLICLMSFFSGCLIYGKGETVGYVYAIEDGILWDKIWYKSSLDSSESDCYLINNDTLKEELKSHAGKDKIKFSYFRHLFTLSLCENNTNDEITSFEIIK